jgi:LmbE family N-acetylglucosaminyl deacetylase
MLRLVAEHPNAEFTWVVFSSAGSEREREARRSAAMFLEGARKHEVVVHDCRDGFFPYEGGHVKELFEELKNRTQPDVIFTHYRADRHQDHRTISDLTWNTWRNHLILEYEIPKYDGDLGAPNLFVPLSKETCDRKSGHICEVFQTQSNKTWLTRDTLLAVMRIRGIECASLDGYAEAFHARKIVWKLSLELLS